MSVDPVWKLRVVAAAKAKQIDQEDTSNTAYFRSVGLLLSSQEQNGEKNIEMGDKDPMVVLQLPYFVG